MLILGDRIFIQESFDNENEIEKVVSNNAEYIFGPSSIYFPKTLIKTFDGAGTIPDGFAIDLASKQWFIVEAELSKHSVWSHIAPQVSKQITASRSAKSRKLLAQSIINTVKDDKGLLEKFANEGVSPIHIHAVITEILEKAPIIGMPIDAISEDLKDWATTLKAEVRLWIISKYVEFGKPGTVMYEFPEEYRPTFETKLDEENVIENGKETVTQYDVRIADLITAQLIAVGEKLHMTYKPQNGQKRDYDAVVLGDGSFCVLDKTFSSPSYAALYCIQDAGKKRKTVNGWTTWRNDKGKLISELRDQYLQSKNATFPIKK
jgi:hypothetical protein